MKFQNFTKTLASLVSILFFFSACSKQDQKLKLVFPKKVNYESFIIANHLGYFGENVEAITVKSGINAAEAMTLGDADMAAMGDGPTVILLSKNKNTSILTRYAKGEKIHRLVTNKIIKNVKDLKGKKIGVQIGSSTHAALFTWLDNNDLKSDDVELIPMNPSNMPEAMKSEQLDAIAGSEPWGLNVEKLCQDKVHELANLSNPQNHSPHILVAKNNTIATKKEMAKQIVDALKKANQFINENPDEATKIAAKYIGLEQKDERVCITRLNWILGWENSDKQSILNTAKFFLKSGKIRQIPNIDNRLNLVAQ
ncbi:MAG: ABC transporter substrate-binding protein [Marinifilum sp.]|jgi:ABC-type nitrate/sulfonate/bicarbonate transport system substrate-binding protein|nr:ABC transporter substrate-binding protein [Marinifilum sp.]